ncbi:haloacid dehalogenase type II [Pelagovum pacificum]|uniref:(S)-2-haloacid dehalogenase n=1 Tax=Pelagovum pacificum TaxID=2588711 RepID=A0A5C5GF80_9RHOB|nr:haloacid dehalogenase type II [Pelagovum pacificum]QQA43485.1 haloacid dehalogenase type II [Pelagovum pacificum]TNY33378.1 haloacid dehalogenase type II [Pelagovum pacificum]
MTITTCIFDAYGTLLDVNAAARTAAAEPGHERLSDAWPALSEAWRRKQLEYSWLRAVADRHTDFWEVTRDALDWAMEATDLDDAILRDRLLDLYRTLDAYPEVPATLAALKDRGLATGILSNGSPAMLSTAVRSAGIEGSLDHVLSVESVGVYKPHPSVYALVTDSFGCTRDDVLFVSSNGWDIAGASAFGFRTLWVNRTGQPQDRLFAGPNATAPDLTSMEDHL